MVGRYGPYGRVLLLRWQTEVDPRDRITQTFYRRIYSFTAADPKPMVEGERRLWRICGGTWGPEHVVLVVVRVMAQGAGRGAACPIVPAIRWALHHGRVLSTITCHHHHHEPRAPAAAPTLDPMLRKPRLPDTRHTPARPQAASRVCCWRCRGSPSCCTTSGT